MNKKTTFKWISFIGNSEDWMESYSGSELAVNDVDTEVCLGQMAEAARCVQRFDGARIALGNVRDNIFIHGLTTPIQLVPHLDIERCYNSPSVPDRGVTVQWLLDNKEEIHNLDPNNILYVEDTAVRFTPHTHNSDRMVITILDAKNMAGYVDTVKGVYIEWLDGTFDRFLAKHGYTDKNTNKTIFLILMLFQAARELGFKDPGGVATHFGGRHLVDELTMKGVFEDMTNIKNKRR